MKLLTSLGGGLAGAITVTILHELIRKIDHSAPRLDKLGEQATAKLIAKTGQQPPSGIGLYATSMAGDIIGNTLYYSLAGTRLKKSLSSGSLLGISAGLGALTLPNKLGLDGSTVNQTPKRKWITVGLYLTGGLVAAGVMRWLDNRNTNKKSAKVATTKTPDEAYKPVLDITV
jgi:hypothetical protein